MNSAERRTQRIYVATSWKNTFQPEVVTILRALGFEVYDFRHPTPRNDGFGWRQLRPEEPPWSAATTRDVLAHPIVDEDFALDFAGMEWADTVLMLQPSGRSAALELGWFVGKGKRSIVLLRDGQEPEIMLKMCDHLCVTFEEVLDQLDARKEGEAARTQAEGVTRNGTGATE